MLCHPVDSQVCELRAEAPVNEAERIAALRGFDVLDTAPEASFDELSRLAGQLCQTPMALVSLVDVDRQWFKSRQGLEAESTDRDSSFCAHALHHSEVFVVPDAHLDDRFRDNPLVTGPPWIRFYAGVPLITEDGFALGTLCVLDTVPRQLSELQLEQLSVLARQVMAQLVLRKRAVELEASQSLLHGVLAATDSLVYAKDLSGRFVLANDAVRRLLGRDSVELIGLDNHQLFDSDTADQYHRHDQEIVATGVGQVYEETLAHSDGTIHQFRSAKFPLRDHAGRIYAVGGVSSDVTELANQRLALEQGRLRWQRLVELSPAAVLVLAGDGGIRYANPSAAALLGGTVECALETMSASDFVDSYEESGEDFVDRVLRNASGSDRRWTLRRLDGAAIVVRANAVLVDYEGEQAVQLELHDITERDAAEVAVRASERRWRALFSDSPVAIVLIDETDVIREVNPATTALFGIAADSIVGRTGLEVARSFEFSTAEQDPAEVIAASPDGVGRTETRITRPDGVQRWVLFTMGHITGPTGRPWTLAHLQDITERKAGEQATADSEANLTAVAEVIADIQSGSDARQSVVRAGRELAGAAAVFLIEPSAGQLTLRVSASTDIKLMDVEVPLDVATVTAGVYRSGEPQFVADARSHPLISANFLTQTKARSLYFAPVRSGDTVTGVLLVAWSSPIMGLDDRRAGAVTLLANQAGIALRQAALVTELESLALTDPLTELPNRRNWDQQLAIRLSVAARSGQALTVAIADLDHFKHFNDSFGHPAGDGLLREFAAASRAAVRVNDVIARWGGEEFAFALSDCTADEATMVLERVRKAVPQGQSCSIGFARWDGTESAAELLARADQALYAVKQGGRNRVSAAA